jgi:hypothetical protein
MVSASICASIRYICAGCSWCLVDLLSGVFPFSFRSSSHLRVVDAEPDVDFFFPSVALTLQDASHSRSLPGRHVCHGRHCWFHLLLTHDVLGRMGALFVGVMLAGM